MTTELVWSTVKPTYEEVKGKKIKWIWQDGEFGAHVHEMQVNSMIVYTTIFDKYFICYADLTAPDPEPKELMGRLPEISMAASGAYQAKWEDYSHAENVKREFTITAIEKPSAILAWNRIAEALDEVEK